MAEPTKQASTNTTSVAMRDCMVDEGWVMVGRQREDNKRLWRGRRRQQVLVLVVWWLGGLDENEERTSGVKYSRPRERGRKWWAASRPRARELRTEARCCLWAEVAAPAFSGTTAPFSLVRSSLSLSLLVLLVALFFGPAVCLSTLRKLLEILPATAIAMVWAVVAPLRARVLGTNER